MLAAVIRELPRRSTRNISFRGATLGNFLP